MRGHSDINTTYLIWIIGKKKRLRSFELQKNTRPQWVDTWAHGTVRWYWSADTLFRQLSIDHNIDAPLVFSWAPKLARKCEGKHWLPCGADGRSVGRCTVTWLPNFLGWVDYQISLAMGLRPRARFARKWSSAISVRQTEKRRKSRKFEEQVKVYIFVAQWLLSRG